MSHFKNDSISGLKVMAQSINILQRKEFVNNNIKKHGLCNFAV